MIHYSCDRCQRLIETDDELRYVLRIEVEAKLGENVFSEDEAPDHLLEIHEIIERQSDALDTFVDDEVYQRKRFDVCRDCYLAFMQNPLGKETSKPVGFSDN